MQTFVREQQGKYGNGAIESNGINNEPATQYERCRVKCVARKSGHHAQQRQNNAARLRGNKPAATVTQPWATAANVSTR